VLYHLRRGAENPAQPPAGRGSTIHLLFYSVSQVARYPVDFFDGALRRLFTYVVPVAFATTFPTKALPGTADIRMLPAGRALALTGLLLTHVWWRYALRHYSSASS
jgi:ABC-2 type transport system permease protein